ncbi:MAG: hypothetical protein U1E12_20435 [Hydrogenophaga sp.]|uniref:hypothetical protein n=1 Tax=Hydrogenophaga sp. TaxID=1904254 RepID=UPI002AB96266|nr:hypothetical protein [Hydrogenophaga sp.]MDZ4104041.1 hypothetical protein [Hydrogenophaga sp.]
MTNQTSQGIGEAASPTCYVLLSSSEFKERLVQLQRGGPVSDWLMDPLMTTSAGLRGEGYPAFQLDKRLNQALLLKLRELYRLHQTADVFVWDFLRTRHKPLGGLTGVDFLLGFFTPAVAAMGLGEREEHFLDLALEEIGRLQQ